jgi:hypothetical protein
LRRTIEGREKVPALNQARTRLPVICPEHHACILNSIPGPR